MTALQWLTWAVLAGVAAALSVVHYRRRETPGRGRLLLAGLRATTLAVALLLLFDPELPAAGPAARAGTQVLLDASLSMALPVAQGGTRWDRGLELARGRAGGRAVLLFGDRARAVPAADLPPEAPGDGRSLLLPALRAAAEAGVRRVVVITDGELEDAALAARWASRLGVEIVTESVGGPLANRSVVEARAPAWAGAGEPFAVEFAVSAPPGDSLVVVARTAGRVLARTTVPAPAPGRLATGSLELRLDAGPAGGPVALEVALEGTDAVPDDDVRTAWVHVGEQPAGIALVSFRPDWEPRFLAPVLEQSLGLPLRAYLAGPAGRFVRLAAGLEAGQPADAETVRQAVARADLVVLHAIGADAPDWALAALRTAPRLLVFPAPDAAGLPLPVQPGPPQVADWIAAAIPPSPVAGLLAGQELAGAAPLGALQPVEVPPGAWAPLLVMRGRQGTPVPALVAGSEGARRWAIATGSGYWQWSFRGGEERELYTRLWGAVGGWLIRDRRTAGLPEVRPASFALPRGTPVAWSAAGLATDSVRVRLTAPDGAAVLDTVVVPGPAGVAATMAPEPGTYGYRAAAWSGDTVIEATGPLTIERYSPEFARPPADLVALREAPTAVRDTDVPAAGAGATPLHATPWPWALLVLLLAAEWILRRRWGLR